MMSPTDQPAASSIDQSAEPEPMGPPRPSAGAPWIASYLWAGVSLIVVVGGIASSLSLSSLTHMCSSDPTLPPLRGLPSCQNLVTYGVVEGAIAGIAIAFGTLLLRQARITKPRRIPVAAGVFVGLVIVLAGIPAAVQPPGSTTGVPPPQLPFPIPVGTRFNATQNEFGAFAEAAIPLDPYAPWAPIELQGGFNSTAPVCFAVSRVAGPDLGPGLGVACGTSVTFVFDLGPATYVFLFYLPLGTTLPQSAQVVITREVSIVY